jgi:hypothetical protein
LGLPLLACSGARYPEGSTLDVTGKCAVFLPDLVEALAVEAKAPRRPAGPAGPADQGYGYDFEQERGTRIGFHFQDGRLLAMNWEVIEGDAQNFDPHRIKLQPGERAAGNAEVPDGAFVGGRWEQLKVRGRAGQDTRLSVRFAGERVEVQLADATHLASCDWEPAGAE